jgi:hypothetical protein
MPYPRPYLLGGPRRERHAGDGSHERGSRCWILYRLVCSASSAGADGLQTLEHTGGHEVPESATWMQHLGRNRGAAAVPVCGPGQMACLTQKTDPQKLTLKVLFPYSSRVQHPATQGPPSSRAENAHRL